MSETPEPGLSLHTGTWSPGGPGLGSLCPREWGEFRGRALGMTSSCYQHLVPEGEADVSSYLQSFFLFAAKRLLLPGRAPGSQPCCELATTQAHH